MPLAWGGSPSCSTPSLQRWFTPTQSTPELAQWGLASWAMSRALSAGQGARGGVGILYLVVLPQRSAWVLSGEQGLVPGLVNKALEEGNKQAEMKLNEESPPPPPAASGPQSLPVFLLTQHN